MVNIINDIIERKVNQIDKSDIEAIGLMGSYSRKEAEKYSDIDIVCILKKDVTKKSTLIEIIEGKYVVTSFVTLDEMEECFTEPESITENILGLQQVAILYDPNNIFKELMHRAMEFQWTSEMQQKADELASKNLVGWIEEVHKALQGFISNDMGRMLNGLFGLTHGIFNVVRIQKGILLNGENSFYNKVIECCGTDSSFRLLSEIAFGVCQVEGIKARVLAGLYLFDEVTDQLREIIKDDDKLAINLTKAEIHKELENRGYSKEHYLNNICSRYKSS